MIFYVDSGLIDLSVIMFGKFLDQCPSTAKFIRSNFVWNIILIITKERIKINSVRRINNQFGTNSQQEKIKKQEWRKLMGKIRHRPPSGMQVSTVEVTVITRVLVSERQPNSALVQLKARLTHQKERDITRQLVKARNRTRLSNHLAQLGPIRRV